MLHNLLSVLQVLAAIVLVVIVMSQTTKHEGLGGAIGGKAQSSFRGRAGLEQQLQRLTMYAAIAFFVISLMVAYVPGW